MNRQYKPVQSVRRKRALRACLAIIVGGSTLTSLGCGIPGLRGAQPGHAIPSDYNWNNGTKFWSSEPQQQTPPLAAPVNSTDATIDGVDSIQDSDLELQPLKDLPDSIDDKPSAGNQDDSASLVPADEPKTFASFIKSVSFISPDTGDEKSDAIDDEIKRMEKVVGDDNDANLGQGDAGDSTGNTSGNSNAAATTADLSVLPSDTEFGMIDTDEGPTDANTGIMPYENSSDLPLAAFYNDPYLLGLITETLGGNQELKILSEEIRIACNETYARSGEYRPFVTLGASAGLDKPGRHTRAGAVEEQLEVAPGKEFPEPLGDFLVAANLSWELDIWNRLRNSQRAAAMRYLGTQEGRNYIITRVVAEVAENYYQLLALDNRLEILKATIEIQQQSLQVAQAKKDAGRGTELAVQRFEAEVQKNISERSLIQQEIVEVENRINYLAGRYPQPVERIDVDFVNLNLSTLGAGVPSELLQNRADIREAERQVAAAGLDIKVARARFYPSLSLTAGLGWNAFSTGYLFRTPESLIYGMAGELVGPLINKRAIQADYRTANAIQLQAIYNYQQTVLQAHIEVVNQITKVENYRRSIEVKKRQLDALQASVEAANKLFQNARAEYVEVLLAQRELMEARMLLVETKQEQLAAVVNAYQALGGGGF
ncbi:TolC family protein [Stieleria varia]|uniref:Cation efflux system protein CusC n=2 Tax=Stieleria varia TaxID=2528005 RepID=A0A5C6A534_9BACT|nr:Cation efflux system protein CusC precursor [Stieleria varia]